MKTGPKIKGSSRELCYAVKLSCTRVLCNDGCLRHGLFSYKSQFICE